MVSRAQRLPYSMRIMASLALSLFLVGLLFNVPLARITSPDSWRIPAQRTISSEHFSDIGPEVGFGVPVTPEHPQETGQSALIPVHVLRDEQVAVEVPVERTEPEPITLTKMRHMPVLDFVDSMPSIEGGLAAYYIHIEYPEEARMRGIEGRLVLRFVVEPDGSTSDISVFQPLHPLCDSAAVQALRRTSFIPGQHRGQRKRVRMQLPVRFMLVNRDSVTTHSS